MTALESVDLPMAQVALAWYTVETDSRMIWRISASVETCFVGVSITVVWSSVSSFLLFSFLSQEKGRGKEDGGETYIQAGIIFGSNLHLLHSFRGEQFSDAFISGNGHGDVRWVRKPSWID